MIEKATPVPNAAEELPLKNSTSRLVEFSTLKRDIWVTGLALMLKFLTVVVFYINVGSVYSVWGVFLFGVLVILKLFYKVGHVFHERALLGTALVGGWLVYGLLPWGQPNVIICWALQMSHIFLSVAFLVLRKKYIVIGVLVLLLYPLQKFALDINVFIVFFSLGWYVNLVIGYYLQESLDPLVMIIQFTPLLRTSSPALFLSYFSLMMIWKIVQLYTHQGVVIEEKEGGEEEEEEADEDDEWHTPFSTPPLTPSNPSPPQVVAETPILQHTVQQQAKLPPSPLPIRGGRPLHQKQILAPIPKRPTIIQSPPSFQPYPQHLIQQQENKGGGGEKKEDPPTPEILVGFNSFYNGLVKNGAGGGGGGQL